MYLSIIKAIYDRPTDNIQGKMVEHFSSKMSNMTRVPTLTTPFQHSTGGLSQSSQARKINKRLQNWKGRLQLSLLADDKIL